MPKKVWTDHINVFCVCHTKFRLEDLAVLIVTINGNSKDEPSNKCDMYYRKLIVPRMSSIL